MAPNRQSRSLAWLASPCSCNHCDSDTEGVEGEVDAEASVGRSDAGASTTEVQQMWPEVA